MDKDSEKSLLEILHMARELVINEHTDRRAQLHNEWLYESEKAWTTQRMKIKYPDIPPYPTEQDVLDRAQTLLKFIVLSTYTTPKQDVVLSITLPEEILEEQTELEQSPPPVELEQPVIELPKLISEPVVQPPIEVPRGLLPAVLNQIEKIRNKF